jgi:hypothetical protein
MHPGVLPFKSGGGSVLIGRMLHPKSLCQNPDFALLFQGIPEVLAGSLSHVSREDVRERAFDPNPAPDVGVEAVIVRMLLGR